MAIRIQIRSGTAAEWLAADPVLMIGELGAEVDTGQFKIGNGEDEWSKLSYAAAVGPMGPTGVVPSVIDGGTPSTQF